MDMWEKLKRVRLRATATVFTLDLNQGIAARPLNIGVKKIYEANLYITLPVFNFSYVNTKILKQQRLYACLNLIPGSAYVVCLHSNLLWLGKSVCLAPKMYPIKCCLYFSLCDRDRSNIL